jgi:hypothetical protein
MQEQHWLDQEPNLQRVNELRERLSTDDAQVLIFLGAGLSFGAARQRGGFEYEGEYDDGRNFPGWKTLVNRMKRELLGHPVAGQAAESLERFFREQGALDCAELFRSYTEGPVYFDFLRRQYVSDAKNRSTPTASHRALTELPLGLVFTTNYDQLIEQSYRLWTKKELVVSASAGEYGDHRADAQAKKAVHLVKLHGTIEHPDTIVLTRTDYARSRRERVEMFGHLLDLMKYDTFLFVGFSLVDPNINMLLDDARLARGGANPISYVVQAGRDPIRDAYFQSLGVRTIALSDWDFLPELLTAINPKKQLEVVLGRHRAPLN